MTSLRIAPTNNGYVVNIEGSIKSNGLYVFRSVDIIEMLEFIGLQILDKKIKVTER